MNAWMNDQRPRIGHVDGLVQNHQPIRMEGLNRLGQKCWTLEMFACDVLDSRCDRLS